MIFNALTVCQSQLTVFGWPYVFGRKCLARVGYLTTSSHVTGCSENALRVAFVYLSSRRGCVNVSCHVQAVGHGGCVWGAFHLRRLLPEARATSCWSSFDVRGWESVFATCDSRARTWCVDRAQSRRVHS